MAGETKKNVCSICDKVGLKAFTKENIFYYYIPLHGTISYGALAINVMNPSLVSKLMPKRDMTNVLLLSTICGTAFYLYGRPHLQHTPNSKRGLYSITGATLFSMGSVLAWAIIKSALPSNNSALCTLMGLASGAVIVKLGTDYLTECDKLVAK